MHALAREARESATLDQPEGAALAGDDARRVLLCLEGSESLLALLDVSVCVVDLHSIHVPPSTLSVCPVMKSLALEARNTTVPTRSSGYWSRLKARAWRRGARYSSESRRRWLSSAMVRPGVIALTLMPSPPTSRASARVRPITAAFELT